MLERRLLSTLVSWTPAVVLAVNGCSAHMMPAPQVPEKIVPQVAVPAEPPAEDEGQVVIDTTNGPATVQVSLLGSWVHPLCATTPCTANLPRGTYSLIFKSRNDPAVESSEIVQVGRAPSIFRHTMGSTRGSYGLYTTGLIVATTGLIIAGVGLLMIGDSSSSKTSTYATIGLGAAGAGAGFYMMNSGRPEITPGSSVQWTPGGAPPPVIPGQKTQALRLTPTGLLVSFK